MLYIKLNKSEKETFRLHLVYSVIEGFLYGIFILNEFIFIKSMNGSNYQVSFLFQFMVVAFVFLLLINEFLRRVYYKKRMLRIVSVITRSPLLFVAFFPAQISMYADTMIYHYIFLGIFFIYYSGQPFIFPTINLFLKQKYRHKNFGKLYSFATTANKATALVSTLLFGLLLDYYPFSYTYVYPFVALLGIGSIFLLSNIDYQRPPYKEAKRSLVQSLRKSSQRMFQILKLNTPFRDFEAAFMLYGFAFMSTATVVTIFYKDVLDLNYTSVAFYKNIFNVLAIFIFPVFGNLIGKIDPRKYAMITFSSLGLFIFFVMLTRYFPYSREFMGIKLYVTLIISSVAYGFFIGTMTLLWNIGSAYFCKEEDAGDYQAVHLTLTGWRGIFAPFLGVFLLELVGYTTTFVIAILSVILAILLMLWSVRSRKLTPA